MDVDSAEAEEEEEEIEGPEPGPEEADPDWEEDVDLETKDLFSDSVFPSTAECLAYMQATYGFDLRHVLHLRGLDLLDAMRLVNAIRLAVEEGAGFGDADWVSMPIPDDPRFLIPVIESDPLLQLVDIEDDDDGADVPPCPTMLTLIHKELEDYRHTQAHGAGDAESSTTARTMVLDEFSHRQFDDPNFMGLRIPISKEEFEWRVNAEYNERCALLADAGEVSRKAWPAFEDGYAPFAKVFVVPAFLPNSTVPIAEITPRNEHLLRSGYQARVPEELPVLTRWFPKGSVPEAPAKYFHVILYSREQLVKESEAMGRPPPAWTSPWGIISVKAELELRASPMQPITIMRNALIAEGGSGVPIDRDRYLEAAQFWSTHALVA